MKKIDRKGFTLVETIIAVAILAVVTVPVVGMFAQTARVDSKARQMQKGTDLAQNMMESIREYTMEAIIDQCQNVKNTGNQLAFMTDWCPEYRPTKYEYNENLDEEVPFEDVSTGAILGNLSADYKDEKVYVTYMGREIRFVFMGIPYNDSYFDAVVTFNCPEKSFQKDVYYLYNVSISIFQSFQGSHVKLAKITGAVQNK